MSTIDVTTTTAPVRSEGRHTVTRQRQPAADPAAGPILLGLARSAIATRGASVPRGAYEPTWLARPGAVFVTLTSNGRLRGCAGSIEPRWSLREDLIRNASAAAFHDARFPPLAAVELPQVRIEVSLLSPPEAVPFTSRHDLVRQLRPGIDGLVLSWHGHRATFLPQVWQRVPDPEDFLSHLLHKARLPELFWDPDVTVRRYTVTSWREPAEPGRRPT